MKTQTAHTLGTAATLERVQELIAAYFFSSVHLVKQCANVWEIHNTRGLIKDFRVIQVGNRFKFQAL